MLIYSADISLFQKHLQLELAVLKQTLDLKAADGADAERIRI